MAAYVIAQVEVTNPTQYAEYQKLVPASLEKYQGRFLVRGGQTEHLEGEADQVRRVVLAFDSVEQAKRWYHSPEYSAAKAARQGAAKMSMLIIDGV
jgi:uncharacterized protein (DUF1330 family)